MIRLQNVKLLIFDVGGVLRESSKMIHEGYRRGFSYINLDFSFRAQDIWHLRGLETYNNSKEAAKALLALTRTNEDLGEILLRDDCEKFLQEIVKENIHKEDEESIEMIVKEYKDFIKSEEAGAYVNLVPHAKEALQIINKKFKLAILSNAPTNTIYRDLQEINLSLFSLILGEDELTKKKPDPEGILKICEQLEIPPYQAAYVGDASGDITAAHSAHCTAVVVLSGMGLKKLLGDADYIFKDIWHLAQEVIE